MNREVQQLYAILRQDLFSFVHRSFMSVVPGAVFVPSWHIEAIAHQLTRCYLGEINRLIITVPPRHLKSIAASVAFPAWLLGHDPTQRIICASYNTELAIKHALDARAVMSSDWYRTCFARTRLDPKKNTQTELMTTRRGSRLATSVGGTLTGRGGGFVIIDDAHKADEALSETRREAVLDWYRNTLLSRLDSKQTGTIIVIQQRLHEDDLVGYLLGHDTWTHLNLPAIAESEERITLGQGRIHVRHPDEPLDAIREPLPVLEEIKTAMGSYVFAAQYQQRPTPLGGGMLKREWFPRYSTPPQIGDYTKVIQSWDTAYKGNEVNDPSVCLTFVMVENDYYLVDVYRERVEYPDLKRAVIERAKRYRATHVLVEDTGSGMSLLQDLRRDSGLPLIDRKAEGDKTIRAAWASALIEAGRVFLPDGAPWLADFEHEVVTFPNGRHDDQVDALSQFVNWIDNHPIGFDFLPIAFGRSRICSDPMSPWYGAENDSSDWDGGLT